MLLSLRKQHFRQIPVKLINFDWNELIPIGHGLNWDPDNVFRQAWGFQAQIPTNSQKSLRTSKFLGTQKPYFLENIKPLEGAFLTRDGQ